MAPTYLSHAPPVSVAVTAYGESHVIQVWLANRHAVARLMIRLWASVLAR